MIRRAVVTCLAIGAPSTLSAQGPRALTSADYARAERFLAPTTSPLVFGAGVRPNWLSAGDDRFWYRTTTPAGWDYFVRNLLGAEPPKEYEIRPPQANRGTP